MGVDAIGVGMTIVGSLSTLVEVCAGYTITLIAIFATTDEAPIGVLTSCVGITRGFGTLVSIFTDNSIPKISRFTRAGPTANGVGTDGVGIAPTVLDETFIDVELAVVARPTFITSTRIFFDQILAGAVVATRVGETFVDRIWRWGGYDDIVTVVATSIDTAFDVIVVLQRCCIARVTAPLILHPIVLFKVVLIATIFELFPR